MSFPHSRKSADTRRARFDAGDLKIIDDADVLLELRLRTAPKATIPVLPKLPWPTS
jgi:hypothetical protein